MIEVKVVIVVMGTCFPAVEITGQSPSQNRPLGGVALFFPISFPHVAWSCLGLIHSFSNIHGFTDFSRTNGLHLPWPTLVGFFLQMKREGATLRLWVSMKGEIPEHPWNGVVRRPCRSSPTPWFSFSRVSCESDQIPFYSVPGNERAQDPDSSIMDSTGKTWRHRDGRRGGA